jgi:hypothetical protein
LRRYRAVLSLALDPRTGDVWAGHHGRTEPLLGRRIDNFTQLNSA